MKVKDAILEINASLLAMKDSTQLFDLILEKVLPAVDHATVGCVLILEDGNMLRIVSSHGYPEAEVPSFRVRLEDTFQWKKSGGNMYDTLIINDLQEFMRTLNIPPDILKDSDGFLIRSTMSTPLIVDGEFLGLLNLDSRDNNVFDDVDRILVEFIRSELPIVIKMFTSYERVKELLSEKDLLIREVHHRIKNNMSAVASLLHLQGAVLSDPAAASALEDSCRRVQCMMVLYEKLYLSEYSGALSAADFLPGLVDEVLDNFDGETAIAVEKRIDDFKIDEKRLQPVGIIVNEILTNIVKYAFRGRKEGRIEVAARKEGGRIRIEIADDGVGMPESIDIGRSKGFGLMLVDNLAQQIGGVTRIERGGGTRFSVEYPA